MRGTTLFFYNDKKSTIVSKHVQLIHFFSNIHLSYTSLFIWDFLSSKSKDVLVKPIQIRTLISVKVINDKIHKKMFWATQKKVLTHIFNFAFF